MYNKNDQIFIMSKRTGYIPQLKSYGPIVNPLKCPISLCLSMLTAGVELHQYDPKTKLVVKLTVTNLYDDNKFAKEEKPEEVLKPAEKINTIDSTDGVKIIDPPTAPLETDNAQDESDTDTNEADDVGTDEDAKAEPAVMSLEEDVEDKEKKEAPAKNKQKGGKKK